MQKQLIVQKIQKLQKEIQNIQHLVQDTKKPTSEIPSPHKNEKYIHFVRRTMKGKVFKTREQAPKYMKKVAEKWTQSKEEKI
jgi:hypothetical protein